MQQAILKPAGRLDTTTVANFERDVLASLATEPAWLLLDFTDLEVHQQRRTPGSVAGRETAARLKQAPSVVRSAAPGRRRFRDQRS